MEFSIFGQVINSKGFGERAEDPQPTFVGVSPFSRAKFVVIWVLQRNIQMNVFWFVFLCFLLINCSSISRNIYEKIHISTGSR